MVDLHWHEFQVYGNFSLQPAQDVMIALLCAEATYDSLT
jgi:hypothetical protein